MVGAIMRDFWYARNAAVTTRRGNCVGTIYRLKILAHVAVRRECVEESGTDRDVIPVCKALCAGTVSARKEEAEEEDEEALEKIL